MLQTTKADASVRPQRTVKGEMYIEMVGDHNRPLLLLDRKMVMPKYEYALIMLRLR